MDFGDDDFDDFTAEELAALDTAEAKAAEKAFTVGVKRAAEQAEPAEAKTSRALPAAAASSDGLAGSLRTYFGFDDFRDGQREVVEAVLAKKDVAVIWTTGRGPPR